ncbi:fimbrial protein, partial [Salmonella enterica subsp. enterica serovar Enteritidis]|nr:fimbrial protein [Salmonella enterica subsp. enterica serovar Enteritidis]EAY3722588.1 fimbrial protein [Salmonella enterica]EBQ7777001.1 fimbrial protein [Salmonella enterica]EDN2963387.1 fimbrial protein [Salmonella enterica subsp. enterica serovar Enteritidis]
MQLKQELLLQMLIYAYYKISKNQLLAFAQFICADAN